MRAGIQPITWGDLPFEQIAKEIKEAGFEGVEAPVASYIGKLDELKRILAENELIVTSTYFGLHLLDKDKQEEEIKSAVEMAKLLKNEFACDVLVVAAGGVQKPVSKEVYALFAKGCDEIGKRCKDLGVDVAFHNHAWTLIETKEEIDFLAEHTSPQSFFFAFDTGHLALMGMDPGEVMAEYKERIRYLHLKDTKDNDFIELGQGIVDFSKVKRVLEDINFKGWLVAELDRSKNPPLLSAKMQRQFIKEFFGV
ncbi:TIM barrel protein [bacterium]|nr:TIM barrel protein [bacterium]